jgi:hypothetical protein
MQNANATEPSPALRCAKKYDLRLRLSQALHCAALRCTALHCAALRCTALHCAEPRKKSTNCFARERSRLHRPRGRTKLYAVLRKKSANRDCDRGMLCAALRKKSANCACDRGGADLCAALRCARQVRTATEPRSALRYARKVRTATKQSSTLRCTRKARTATATEACSALRCAR